VRRAGRAQWQRSHDTSTRAGPTRTAARHAGPAVRTWGWSGGPGTAGPRVQQRRLLAGAEM